MQADSKNHDNDRQIARFMIGIEWSNKTRAMNMTLVRC